MYKHCVCLVGQSKSFLLTSWFYKLDHNCIIQNPWRAITAHYSYKNAKKLVQKKKKGWNKFSDSTSISPHTYPPYYPQLSPYIEFAQTVTCTEESGNTFKRDYWVFWQQRPWRLTFGCPDRICCAGMRTSQSSQQINSDSSIYDWSPSIIDCLQTQTQRRMDTARRGDSTDQWK